MIVIAILAGIMASLPTLARFQQVRGMSVRIQGASLWILIDLMPGAPVRTGSGSILFGHVIYLQIPLLNILVFLGIMLLLIAVIHAFRVRRGILTPSKHPQP